MSKTSTPKSPVDAAAWIRERIRIGRLVPGQRLIEADLVRDSGMSRGKVREALRRLEAEGLVSIEEFRGASVRQLGKDEVRQIYEARMALEGFAAAAFAASRNTALKQRLATLQEQLNAAASNGLHDQFALLNHDWHKLILEGAGNTYITQFLAQLTVPIYQLLFPAFYARERISQANADHQLITAAIIAGRATAAERAMRAHIRSGLAALTELSSHFDS
jgi:DNA-binding GntR family transcriptional regulator